VALFALGLASLLLLRAGRHRPWLAVGWLWYLGTLVPVIGLVQVGAQAMADRYTYLPLTGLFVAAAWSIRGAVAWRGRAVAACAAACAAVLLVLAVMARSQTAVWRDSFSLARHALRATRGNWLAHGQLATAAAAQGDLDTAQLHYLEALAIVPRHAPTHNNLGSVYAHAGRGDEALRHIRRAVELDPGYAPAHLNLAIVAAAAGNAGEAESAFRRAIALDPEAPHAWDGLGSLLLAGGRVSEAVEAYQGALARDPEYADARFNLGLALLRRGDAAAAAASLGEAARIRPGDIATQMVLGDTLLSLGRSGEAEQAYLGALAVDPRLQAARDGVARARALTPGRAPAGVR
jgi:tetratricopeptide (TPR) repeat protein